MMSRAGDAPHTQPPTSPTSPANLLLLLLLERDMVEALGVIAPLCALRQARGRQQGMYGAIRWAVGGDGDGDVCDCVPTKRVCE